ncbi:ABATE domain-containing protein [Streptosporangium sandarakinum]|uniref:ABATE domain-containing protein n=1 Tax=Streptosporangium sandarakinum TaxID=1260955 RepID=UPI003D92B152
MSDTVPLTGEPLALDLINTSTAVGDLLATPADLRAWLELQAGRFGEARELVTAGLAAADLAAVRDVRDRTARVLDHVRRGERPRPTTWTPSTGPNVPRPPSPPSPGTARRSPRSAAAPERPATG